MPCRASHAPLFLLRIKRVRLREPWERYTKPWTELKGEKMKLSKQERLNYMNQFKILAALYPNDSNYYNEKIKALEYGFELHYNDIFEILYEDEMTEDECLEVLDILSMYRAITFSYEKLEAKEQKEFDSRDLEFEGFDGNNEIKQYVYARYFINDLDRFQELKKNEYDDFNSHHETLSEYRRMLRIWNSFDNKNNLSFMKLKELLVKPWR